MTGHFGFMFESFLDFFIVFYDVIHERKYTCCSI